MIAAQKKVHVPPRSQHIASLCSTDIEQCGARRRGADQASHLLKAMAAQGEGASCCEAYVWFVRGPAAARGEEEAAALATLGRECPTRVRSGVYGCETP